MTMDDNIYDTSWTLHHIAYTGRPGTHWTHLPPTEKSGGALDSTITPTATGTLYELIYEKATYKFIVSGPLLLSRSDAAHLSHLTAFLGASSTPLRLSGAFVYGAVRAYAAAVPAGALGNVRVTVGFGAPVAPALRTLEIDVPAALVGGDVLDVVARRVEERTGMRLALDADGVVRLARVTCAAFALGGEGRIKVVARGVREANEELFRRILDEARARDG